MERYGTPNFGARIFVYQIFFITISQRKPGFKIGCGYSAGPVPPYNTLVGGTGPFVLLVRWRDRSLRIIFSCRDHVQLNSAGMVPPYYSLTGGTYEN